MDTYTIGDWVMAGWSLTELGEKAKSEGWTAQRVIEWCFDHADDAAQEAEVRAMPGYDELVAILEDKIEDTRPTLRDLAARAGYANRIDIQRLLADLRRYPGCAELQSRTLSNYLSGYTHMPLDVAGALCGALKITMDELMEAK